MYPLKLTDIPVQNSISYLSIAHRPAVLKHHNKLLLLDGRGGWTLSDIPKGSQ
jgi:hypothetical protein